MSVMGHLVVKMALMKSTVQVCFLICLLARHHKVPRLSVSGICRYVMGHQIVKMAQMKSTVQVCFYICCLQDITEFQSIMYLEYVCL